MRVRNILIIVMTGITLLSGCKGVSDIKDIEFNDSDLASIKMYNAVFYDNANLAEEALEMGENPNKFSSDKVGYLSAKRKRENNPLAMAVGNHRYEVSEYLLENGAEPDVLNVDGLTLLELSNVDFARTLIEYGADIKRNNSKGKDLFEVKASLLGEPEVIEWAKLCIENGYEITAEKLEGVLMIMTKSPME
ncbi:MAG: ankyrin repeat domain-containing protein [Clostridia bacterium]